MNKRLSFFLLFLAMAALAGADSGKPQAGGAEVALTQLDSQNQYYIHGAFETASAPEEVWKVLSDYPSLGGILSSLKSSRVLERRGDTALVEQVMVGKFLFFSRTVRLLLKIKEEAPWRIAFSDTGDSPFKHYEGSWQIDRTPQGCRVDYTLDVSRGDMAPPFLETRLFRENSLTLMRELSREVERRAGLPTLLGNAPARYPAQSLTQIRGALQ